MAKLGTHLSCKTHAKTVECDPSKNFIGRRWHWRVIITAWRASGRRATVDGDAALTSSVAGLWKACSHKTNPGYSSTSFAFITSPPADAASPEFYIKCLCVTGRAPATFRLVKTTRLQRRKSLVELFFKGTSKVWTAARELREVSRPCSRCELIQKQSVRGWVLCQPFAAVSSPDPNGESVTLKYIESFLESLHSEGFHLHQRLCNKPFQNDITTALGCLAVSPYRI